MKKVVPKIGTLEAMQDIRYLLTQLKIRLATGLKDNLDIYSTVAEDYINTDNNNNIMESQEGLINVNTDESDIFTDNNNSNNKNDSSDNKWLRQSMKEQIKLNKSRNQKSKIITNNEKNLSNDNIIDGEEELNELLGRNLI